MKTILIALAFIPIFAVGQTRVGLIHFEDGSTKPLEELTGTPTDTSYYVAHDSLSREMNDSIYLAGGKEVLISVPNTRISYTWDKMLITTVENWSRYESGRVIPVKKTERKECFPWPLMVLLLVSFILVTFMQGKITFKSFYSPIHDWFDIGGWFDKVMFTLVGWCFSLLSGGLFSFYFLDGELLVGATVLFVISLMMTSFINSWMRNIWIGGVIVWMSFYLIFWPPSDWVPVLVTLLGILLGLPTIYFWRWVKRERMVAMTPQAFIRSLESSNS